MAELATREFQAVRIGRQRFPFTSCEAVSAAYRQTIEALDLGASDSPPCEILNSRAEVVGYVSYNGKVWLGDERSWAAGKAPIFDPYR